MRGPRREPGIGVARAIIAHQTGRCAYCNRSLMETSIHWDHFVPFSYTGTNRSANWVAACPQCNMAKGNRHLISEEAIYDFCFEMAVRHGDRTEGWPEGAEAHWPWAKDLMD